jgi:hypothetical protein
MIPLLNCVMLRSRTTRFGLDSAVYVVVRVIPYLIARYDSICWRRADVSSLVYTSSSPNDHQNHDSAIFVDTPVMSNVSFDTVFATA